MTVGIYTELAARLRTMKGMPAWDGDMSAFYWERLKEMPDEIARVMVTTVLDEFENRPSVKAILEWRARLTPGRLFDINAIIDDHPQGHPRTPVSCPPHISAELHTFYARKEAEAKSEKTRPAAEGLRIEDRGNWGLQYPLDSTGRPGQRFPARFSQAEAQRRCEAIRAQYPGYPYLHPVPYCAGTERSRSALSQRHSGSVPTAGRLMAAHLGGKGGPLPRFQIENSEPEDWDDAQYL